MPHDGSLASQLEDWLVTQVQTIDEIPNAHVETYGGVAKFDAAMAVITDIRGKRNPHVLIINDGFAPRDLRAEGVQDFMLQFTIWISNQNKQSDGAIARRGQNTKKVGTNLLAEKVFIALDGKFPALSTTDLLTGEVQVQPGQALTLEKGFSLVQLTVTVRTAKK